MIRPAPCAKTSDVSTATAEFSSARLSSIGFGCTPACRNAERTHAATPQAFGDDIEVPWYWALPWRQWRGIGEIAPPGAQSVGR